MKILHSIICLCGLCSVASFGMNDIDYQKMLNNNESVVLRIAKRFPVVKDNGQEIPDTVKGNVTFWETEKTYPALSLKGIQIRRDCFSRAFETTSLEEIISNPNGLSTSTINGDGMSVCDHTQALKVTPGERSKVKEFMYLSAVTDVLWPIARYLGAGEQKFFQDKYNFGTASFENNTVDGEQLKESLNDIKKLNLICAIAIWKALYDKEKARGEFSASDLSKKEKEKLLTNAENQIKKLQTQLYSLCLQDKALDPASVRGE